MILAQRDDLTPLTALLLGLTVDDTDGFDEQREEFLERLADEGSDYIGELLDQPRLTSTAAKQTAEFLEEFPLDEVGAAWQADETVEITADNGLSVDDEAFYYRLNGHGDPFAKNLLELAANQLLTATTEEAQVDAVELLSQLAGDDDGATCGKCHAVGQTREIGQLTWQYRGQTDRPLSRYTHSPHINLLGLGESCNSCHLGDEEADYGDYFDLLASGEQPELSLYKSNFHPITIEQCSSCHQQNAVRDNCMLCHNYHQSLTLSGDALQRESTSSTPVSDTESVISNIIPSKEQP
jgi:hypothetical protein